MKKILATAYAVNPYKGSEDGTGWNLLLQMAKFQEVIAVTRENNKPFIERYLLENDVEHSERISFLYFDLPYWMRFWKKGERGALLYFYLWQLGLPLFVKKNRVSFDIAHNLNFHNDWTPTFLWVLGKPLVWGPVGHHPKMPAQYIKKVYGWKAYWGSRVLWGIKRLFWTFDPLLKLSYAKADAVIAMNSGVSKVIRLSEKLVYRMPAVGAEKISVHSPKNDKFVFLSVGRLVPMKGFDLALASFAKFYQRLPMQERKGVELQIVGKGPQYWKLKEEIEFMGLSSSVKLIDWVPKEQMDSIYGEASVFLFPSHEGAGMVVPEALAHGLPVVCFDNEGPGEFIDASCGIKIPYGKYQDSVIHLADSMYKLYSYKGYREALEEGARENFRKKFDWNVKGEILRGIYEHINLNTNEKNRLRSFAQ